MAHSKSTALGSSAAQPANYDNASSSKPQLTKLVPEPPIAPFSSPSSHDGDRVTTSVSISISVVKSHNSASGDADIPAVNGRDQVLSQGLGKSSPSPPDAVPTFNRPNSSLLSVSRPSLLRFHSSPAFPTLSPTRHQFRLPNSTPRQIKETLNASLRQEPTGTMVNQYLIKEEIGQGTFGTVRIAIDTTTQEQYAIKEYSKSRLRKLNRTHMVQQRRMARKGRDISAYRMQQDLEANNPLNLIRREIAIMKKLDHPNIVNLIEVLDDPLGDSLFMILEWCEKGSLMPTNMGLIPSLGSPLYTEDQCRVYFRDIILGIEYLHSQGVVHRDIKADNLLLSDDDVVKISDFGVSEMFAQDNDVITKKAGSPAYMPPELAILSHAMLVEVVPSEEGIHNSSVSGRAADIWSMGVTLYFLLFGILPFQSENLLDLCEKIIKDPVYLPPDSDANLVDLFSKILCKSPAKRIKMPQLREHPWVTCDGADLLLDSDENCAESITPVTEDDLQSAIERIQGRVDPRIAINKLKRLHGWRASSTGLDSSRGSTRESSTSPSTSIVGMGVQDPSSSPSLEKMSLLKLTRALDEIIQKEERRHPNNVLNEPLAASQSQPVSEISSPYSLGMPSGQLTAIPSVIPPLSPISYEEKTDNPKDPTTVDDKIENIIETNLVNENMPLTNETKVERRPSRTKVRVFLGLDGMTSVRSRSLDTHDRL